MLQYLSPTSIALAISDPVAFHRKYILGQAIREPQTLPMALGAAFDAFLKGELRSRLYGEKGIAKELMAANVEPQNYETAMPLGYKALLAYTASGGLAELMRECAEARGKVRMEATVRDDITFRGKTVPLLGKPDLYWYTDAGRHVVYDFKVNGYSAASYKPRPAPGGYQDFGKRGFVTDLGPIRDWVNQLLVYGWVLGEPIGADTEYGIEQLLGPDMELWHYRWQVPAEMQYDYWDTVSKVWENRNRLPGMSEADIQAMEDPDFALVAF